MAAEVFADKAIELVQKIRTTQLETINKAADVMATSIAQERAVHVFGSGHSVMSVFDIFPRYGGYVGFHPIMDARLQWQNVTGSGGAQELIWLERQEGYIDVMMRSHKHELDARDTMLLISHGGMNAAAIDMALLSKKIGLTVVAITSVANRALNQPKHSSGKALHDIADIVIDNCSPPEDAVVSIEGLVGNVAATSTVTSVTICMMLVAEVAAQLAKRGKLPPRIFVSPNVQGVPPDNNMQVFVDYDKFVANLRS